MTDVRRTHRWRYGLALLPSTLVLLVNVGLLTGTLYPRWDASNFFAPAQMLVAEAARSGELHFWNPWIAAGAPDAADPQLGTWSPLNVGLGLLFGPGLTAFCLYWLLIWWWGAVGVVVLARHLGAPAWGAAVVAVAHASSGFFVGHAQHTAILVSLSWLPWIVWRFEVGLATGRRLPAVQAGALWGLAALSGYPGTTILNGLYLAAWGVGGVVRRGFSGEPGVLRASVRRTATSLLLVVAIGGAVLTPAYWPLFRDGSGYTDRTAALPREKALGSNTLHPGALATFASPYLSILDLLDEDLWPSTESSNSSIYLPAAVLLLAGLSLLGPVDRWRVFLALLAAFALGCALSQALPFRGWLYDWIPPTRYFRHSVVFRGYFLFTSCVLALLAARDLQARVSIRRRAVGLGVALTLAAVGTLFAMTRIVDSSESHLIAASAVAILLWSSSAALVALAAGVSRSRQLVFAMVVVLVTVDGAAALRLSRQLVVTWDVANQRVWREVREARARGVDPLRAGESRELRSRFGTDRNNRNAVAREAVLASDLGLRSSFYSLWLENPLLSRAVTGKRRFYSSGGAPRMPWTRGAFRAFERKSSELGGMPIVLHRRREVLSGDHAVDGASSALEGLSAAAPARVALLRYAPSVVELRVSMEEPGVLLMADRFARGWRAWIDDVETEILPANFLFRAVEVPAGTSRVRMIYRPAGHPWLLLLGWGTLSAVIVASLERRRRARASSQTITRACSAPAREDESC